LTTSPVIPILEITDGPSLSPEEGSWGSSQACRRAGLAHWSRRQPRVGTDLLPV